MRKTTNIIKKKKKQKRHQKQQPQKKTKMSRKLIIDGNAVYEIDEKCMLKKKIGELKEKKITSDEKRAEQSVVTGKPNRLKR